MAIARGGAPGSRLVTQLLDPSWGEHVVSLGAGAALPYAPLTSHEDGVAAARGAGWQGARLWRGLDFVSRYGRAVHEGVALCFVESDPFPDE